MILLFYIIYTIRARRNKYLLNTLSTLWILIYKYFQKTREIYYVTLIYKKLFQWRILDEKLQTKKILKKLKHWQTDFIWIYCYARGVEFSSLRITHAHANATLAERSVFRLRAVSPFTRALRDVRVCAWATAGACNNTIVLNNIVYWLLFKTSDIKFTKLKKLFKIKSSVNLSKRLNLSKNFIRHMVSAIKKCKIL